jgi:hypothetical protein
VSFLSNASCIVGITGPCHHAWLTDWDRAKSMPGLASNHNPPDLHLLSIWDYRYEPLCPVVDHSLWKQYWSNLVRVYK